MSGTTSIHATTVLSVRRDAQVVIAADGQVTFDKTIMKHGGRNDPIVPAKQTERLAKLLETAGAEVTVHWEEGGHAITKSEIDAASRWLSSTAAPPR